MKARLALSALALLAGSCTCAPPPEGGTRTPPGERPTHPGIRGRVSTPPGQVAPSLEVRIIPEAAMADFVATRLGEARAELERLAGERDRAARDARDALAASDRVDQEWKATTANDLYRRVEVILRKPRDPAEVHAIHADLLARKKAAYARAVAAARRSREKERAFDDLEQEARRFREARFFTEGLPPAVRDARTTGDGAFAIDLPPGRYALVAREVDATPDATVATGWLLWIVVEPGAPASVLLDASNRHGTDCDACVVPVRNLP